MEEGNKRDEKGEGGAWDGGEVHTHACTHARTHEPRAHKHAHKSVANNRSTDIGSSSRAVKMERMSPVALYARSSSFTFATASFPEGRPSGSMVQASMISDQLSEVEMRKSVSSAIPRSRKVAW